MERINLSSIKKESIRAIFRAITEREKISRAEIAEETGLSLMTVGKVADALLERGVIVQEKEVKNIAGRKAGLVSLNGQKYMLAIDLTGKTFSMVTLDIGLNVSDRITYEYNSDYYYEENLYIFIKQIKIYILKKLEPEHCIGIGVILPGSYQPQQDVVEGGLLPEIGTTHIKAIIEDILSMPVTVLDKDVLLAATSNLTEYENSEKKCVAYVCIGETVSGALLSEGKPLHSRHGYAGDIGRVVVMPNGKTLNGVYEEYRAAHTGIQGLPEELMQYFVIAISHELAVTDPDILIVECCFRSEDAQMSKEIIRRIADYMHSTPEALPEIHITAQGIRHAYRGLAMALRSVWIQNEI